MQAHALHVLVMEATCFFLLASVQSSGRQCIGLARDHLKVSLQHACIMWVSRGDVSHDLCPTHILELGALGQASSWCCARRWRRTCPSNVDHDPPRGDFVHGACIGKQLVLRPALAAFPAAHAWSVGASDGRHAIKLDTLDEGQTRLLACTPASLASHGWWCSRLLCLPQPLQGLSQQPVPHVLLRRLLHMCQLQHCPPRCVMAAGLTLRWLACTLTQLQACKEGRCSASRGRHREFFYCLKSCARSTPLASTSHAPFCRRRAGRLARGRR